MGHDVGPAGSFIQVEHVHRVIGRDLVLHNVEQALICSVLFFQLLIASLKFVTSKFQKHKRNHCISVLFCTSYSAKRNAAVP